MPPRYGTSGLDKLNKRNIYYSHLYTSRIKNSAYQAEAWTMIYC
jgi:hypothetical protein